MLPMLRFIILSWTKFKLRSLSFYLIDSLSNLLPDTNLHTPNCFSQTYPHSVWRRNLIQVPCIFAHASFLLKHFPHFSPFPIQLILQDRDCCVLHLASRFLNILSHHLTSRWQHRSFLTLLPITRTTNKYLWIRHHWENPTTCGWGWSTLLFYIRLH